MVLSRFWTFLLTAVAILGLATAMLAASLVNDSWQRSATNDLIRDRFEVEAILKLDARARLDAIAPIAANSDVRSALRRASARDGRGELDEALVTGLRTKLGELNGQLDELRGDLMFAVDDEGWIVAAIAGAGTIPDGAGLGQFPLVRRALEGHVRDDVWVYQGSIYRMAARPVIQNGQYVGALIHGKRFDDALAERLSNRLDGASVGFFMADGVFASYMPTGVQQAPTREEMAGPLGSGVLENEELQGGSRTEPQDLSTGGLAVYSLVTGTARFANVGYVIARPVRSLAQPWELMDHASGDAWASLPWPFLGGGGVLAFLLAMFFFWVERDRPLSKLLKHAKALRGAPENRFTITDFGGRYRKITNEVNEALDAVAAAGGNVPRGKAANLDELLGPTDDEPASGSFFGFAGNENQQVPDFPAVGGGPAPGAPAGSPPPPANSPLSNPLPAAAKPAPPPPKPPAPPGPPPGVPATAVMPTPQAPPRPPPPRSSKPDLAEEEPTSVSPQAPPAASGRKQLKSTLLGVAPPTYDEDDEDGATMVARVPQELLDATSGAEADEAAHFREVYDKFVATKKQCGESTAGLTFEKFSGTLRKNRDAIVNKHGAKKVRFTVYTKNGKAALKATPIKE